jgi:hypothetical protein
MRVQLSPWEVLETSLPFPSEKRRKRSSNAGRKSDLTSLPYALAVAASFVTGRRPRHSKKARHGLASNPEDLLPTLVVTLGHHIAVVGKSPTSQGGSTDWQVSSLLQSASRPGQATAFLPSNNSTDSKKRTQTVSFNGLILSHRFFAFTLCSHDATSIRYYLSIVWWNCHCSSCL